MREFAALVSAIDSTTRTTGKLEALVHFLQHSSDEDSTNAAMGG